MLNESQKKYITEQFLTLLNDAFAADPKAIEALFEHREACNVSHNRSYAK